MKKSGDNLYTLKIHDAVRASRVLFPAFKHDAKFLSLFSNASSAEKEMPVLINFLVNYNIRYGLGYATSDKLEGIALWQDSFSGFSLIKAVKSGFLDLVKGLSAGSLVRLLRSYKKINNKQKDIFPQKYMGLELLGVDPDHQKQGHAGTLLRSMFNRLDARKLPCCLMTNTEINVIIYEKYSFKIVGDYFDKESNIYSYFMIREPQDSLYYRLM